VIHNNDELSDMKNVVFIAFIIMTIICLATALVIYFKFPNDLVLMRKYEL